MLFHFSCMLTLLNLHWMSFSAFTLTCLCLKKGCVTLFHSETVFFQSIMFIWKRSLIIFRNISLWWILLQFSFVYLHFCFGRVVSLHTGASVQQREWHCTGWRTPWFMHFLMQSGPLFRKFSCSFHQGKTFEV